MASRRTRLKVNLLRARRCLTQKVGWATYPEALDAAELMMEVGHVKPGCHITPYACAQCGAWHVRNRMIVAVGFEPSRR